MLFSNLKQFDQKANFHKNPTSPPIFDGWYLQDDNQQNTDRSELMRLIQNKYIGISNENTRREKLYTNLSIGAGALFGAIGGAAALLFTGPIAASAIAVSVGAGMFKAASAGTRDENRKKLARSNTSNRNR